MKVTENQKQKNFFNAEKNQYSEKLILNPPYHTQLEIKSIISRVIKLNKNFPIIDFGSGTGRLTIPLLKSGFKIISVDISSESLNKLKRTVVVLKLKRNEYAKDLSDMENINAVVGADILHHVDISETLPKIYKSLKYGGKIIFSEPGAFNPSWYLFLPLTADWEVEKGVMNCSYFNLINKLKTFGFKKIKITGLGLFPRPFFNWCEPLCRFNDWLGNRPILKLFAYRFIIEAEK